MFQWKISIIFLYLKVTFHISWLLQSTQSYSYLLTARDYARHYAEKLVKLKK